MPLAGIVRLIALALLLVTAGGCSGVHPYRSRHDKNLTVRTKIASGSVFTRVGARVDIYAVDEDCHTTYQGSVDLKEPEVDIGLPAGGANYLTFVFSNSTFLASHRGATAYDGYFRTRPGYEYVAEASYAEGIYDVILKERKAGSNQLRELEFGGCRP
jgi:hypothetical protein